MPRTADKKFKTYQHQENCSSSGYCLISSEVLVRFVEYAACQAEQNGWVFTTEPSQGEVWGFCGKKYASCISGGGRLNAWKCFQYYFCFFSNLGQKWSFHFFLEWGYFFLLSWDCTFENYSVGACMETAGILRIPSVCRKWLHTRKGWKKRNPFWVTLPAHMHTKKRFSSLLEPQNHVVKKESDGQTKGAAQRR